MLKALQGGGWTLTILAIASLAINAANSQVNTDSTDYQTGYTLGVDAYKYGLPLVTMEWTKQVQTNGVGVNKLVPMRAFATPADVTVVAPNFDTLYNIGWLDLTKGPVVITVPEIIVSDGRFWVVPLYSPYTENFANLGSVQNTKAGDYAVVGPKWHEKLPANVQKIQSPYDRVWIIERIYANSDNATDVSYVNRLQDLITLKPLKKPWIPSAPVEPAVSPPVFPTGMAFYDMLCDQLEKFPAPPADYPELLKLLEICFPPGFKPSTNPFLSADKKAGMIAAATAGPNLVVADAKAMLSADFKLHNGYLMMYTGTYGTNYTLRAVVTKLGLGALIPTVAIYPLALSSRTGTPLLGSSNFIVTIPAGGFPPVATPPAGFWSLTMYTNQGFLVPNLLNRFNINDRSNLTKNADGSVTVYIQSTPPANTQNWLPSPPGAPFQLIWRFYATRPDQIDPILAGTGYKVPAIMPA